VCRTGPPPSREKADEHADGSVTESLFLVRHGGVEGYRPGVLLGRTDAHLSRVGRAQAALVGRVIPLSEVGRFVTSPLARARETARLLLPDRTADIDVDPDLREIDFGRWEGLTYDEVSRSEPGLASAWSQFAPEFAFPEGENLQDFSKRIERAGHRLAGDDSRVVVAFTHGGVIRSLICHFLGLPLRDYLLFDVTPGSVVVLHLWEGRGVLGGLWPGERLPA
jgi:alpha-ribazole phosphatase